MFAFALHLFTLIYFFCCCCCAAAFFQPLNVKAKKTFASFFLIVFKFHTHELLLIIIIIIIIFSLFLSLTHSLAGVSRSITILIAYLMSVTSLNWKDALKCVRAARAIANPNLGFQKQLQEFEGRCLREVS